MAKPNYSFEKRQREQEKKRKKADKEAEKAARKAQGPGSEAPQTDEPPAPAPGDAPATGA